MALAPQPAKIQPHSHPANPCGSSGPLLRDPAQLRWPSQRPAWHRANAQPGAPTQTGKSPAGMRSEEHTSELQSPDTISYAVFCLKKKKKNIAKPQILLQISNNFKG